MIYRIRFVHQILKILLILLILSKKLILDLTQGRRGNPGILHTALYLIVQPGLLTYNLKL